MSATIQKLLQDPTARISYENLTQLSKTNLVKTGIIFQGASTTFYDIIGYGRKVLRHLTSDNILKILVDNEAMQIGKTYNLNVEHEYFERKFLDVNIEPKPNHGNHYEEKNKTFEEIRELAEDSETFLLSDYASSGKTTAFKYFVEKLKQCDENVWVSYIELRNHTNVLNTIDDMELSISNVQEILLNLIEAETELEKQIFKQLFSDGSAILLFDGFDEVSPKYTAALIRLFKFLDKCRPKNQLWISTRPHLLSTLQEVFDVPAYKFAPLTTTEKENLILTLLKDNDINDESTQKETVREIMSYLRKFRPHCCSGQDVDIFFMIETISEYCITNAVNPNEHNNYNIFAYLVEKQKELAAPEIPIMERDNDSLLTIWEYHRIEAFPGPNSLAIKKKWLKDEKNWTTEMLQRYGFMTDKSNKSRYEYDDNNFIHEVYRSFFAAQFIINFLYDDNENTNDEDLKSCIDTLNWMIVQVGKTTYLYSDFLISYFMSHGKDKVLHERVKKVICDNIQRINYTEKDSYMSCKYYATFLSIDPTITAKYFKIGENVNLLDDLVLNGWMNFRQGFIVAAEICFGLNWYQKFSNSIVITDEEMEQLRGQKMNEIKWNQDKNLLKICDIYCKSENSDVKRLFFANLHNFYCFNGPIQVEILSRMHLVQTKEQFIEKCFMKIYYGLLAPEAVKFILNRIEEYFSAQFINQFLFEDNPDWTPVLIQSLYSEDPEVFRLTRDFYVKYKNSWNEIQNIFMNVCTYNFFVACTTVFYSDYKKFIEEVFATDMSKIISRASDTQFIASSLQCDNTKDFVDWILSNSE